MSSLIWLAIAIVALVIELVTVGLVSIWFSIAAFVVSILSVYVTNLTVQIFVYAILSLVLLVLTKKLLRRDKFNIGFDSSFVGTKVKLESKENDYYLVRFKGVLYKAISKNDLVLGEYYTIKDFEGNKIILEE